MSTDPTAQLCECGCGQPAGVYAMTQRRGQPRRFINGHNLRGRRWTNTAEERFWAKVDRGDDDECWEWRGTANRAGYGYFWFEGRRVSATHWSYENSIGPLPPGLDVLHRCDNPPCVNPAHLFAGDQKANADDMIAKGRSARGERARHAKLTEADVREIRRRGTGVYGAAPLLAAEFGVTAATVNYVLRGQTWRHVA